MSTLIATWLLLVSVSTQLPKTQIPKKAAEYVYLHELSKCESSLNERAVSPSGKYLGAWQFDRSTWEDLTGKYGLVSFRDRIMSGDHQLVVLTYMLKDESIVWENRFPDCVKNKVGLPPGRNHENLLLVRND